MSRYLTDDELNAMRASAPMRDGFYHVVGTYHVIRAEDFAALLAEVDRLRAENRKLRDVLAWSEAQCPGKCSGVCGDALSGERRREEE